MSTYSLITFHSENVSFQLDTPDQIVDWINNAIINEAKIPGEISYVFCSDDYLHKINLEYLNHDTFTDIITFNYCDENIINSDIFISIDRVSENAQVYKTSFIDELNRVMIHGILHLVGYDDKTESDKVNMRAKEDFYLSLRAS